MGIHVVYAVLLTHICNRQKAPGSRELFTKITYYKFLTVTVMVYIITEIIQRTKHCSCLYFKNIVDLLPCLFRYIFTLLLS